jgi:hypothetical protein
LDIDDDGWRKRKGPELVLGAGSVLGFTGPPEGRVPPISFLEESMPKTLIQYKRRLRKPKLVVGQGDHDDVGFLRWGFLKSSSSHLFSLVPDALSVGEAASGIQPFSPLEWAMICSTVGFWDKGVRGWDCGLPLCP